MLTGGGRNQRAKISQRQRGFAERFARGDRTGGDGYLDKRVQWQDILDKLSAFPLQERDGRTVFRYAERGMAWCDGNTLGIQHIFPAGAIGLDIEAETPEELAVAISGELIAVRRNAGWLAAMHKARKALRGTP